MGNCVNACENIIKIQKDLSVDSLYNANFENLTLTQRFHHQPFYSKIIFLQIKIKKFLKNQKKNLKKGDDTSILITTTTQGRNNTDNKETKQNTTNSNNNSNNNNNSFVLIPSVKAELRDSLIFSNDPFLKGKKTYSSQNKINDPRDGPFDNVRHSFPKIIEDESSYEGEWKNGKRDGFGILCWRNISKFIGQFSEDKVLGFGKLVHEDGDTYTGYWNDFQAQGIGYYKTKKKA